MRKRFTVEVERTADGYVATSPEHPGARGHSDSLAASLSELGATIEARNTASTSQQQEIPVERPKSAETPCFMAVDEVDSSASSINETAEVGRMTMPRKETDPIVAETPSGRSAPARPMPAAEAWLRRNAERYAGRWVALRDDELVAVADSFAELRSRLRTVDDVLVTLVT